MKTSLKWILATFLLGISAGFSGGEDIMNPKEISQEMASRRAELIRLQEQGHRQMVELQEQKTEIAHRARGRRGIVNICPGPTYPEYPEFLDTVCDKYSSRPCCQETETIYNSAEKFGITKNMVYPKCNKRGYYKSLQCDESGYYCVNHLKKRLGPSAKDPKRLDCTRKIVVPVHNCPGPKHPEYPEFLDTVCFTYSARPCCLEAEAIYNRAEEFGITKNMMYPKCDKRGYYKSLQCDESGYYCVDHLKKRLGPSEKDPKRLDCARL